MKAAVEYTEWDRPHGYASKSAAGPFSFAAATSFEAQDNGTLVSPTGQVQASGIMRLTEGLLVRRTAKQDQSNYDTLKRILEAS